MEAVRQVVDAHRLSGVISLPNFFRNKKVEVIIMLSDEKSDSPPRLPHRDIDAMLKGSVTESLIGALPNAGRTLGDYRAERLGKYESVN